MTPYEELQHSATEALRSLQERAGREPVHSVIADTAKALENWLQRMCAILSAELVGEARGEFQEAERRIAPDKPRSGFTAGQLAQLWEQGRLGSAWRDLYPVNPKIQAPNLKRVNDLRAGATHDRPVPLLQLDMQMMLGEINYFAERHCLLLAPPSAVPGAPAPQHSLPGGAEVSNPTGSLPARGWIRVDAAFLDRRNRVSDTDFLKFFDGASPGWGLVQDVRLPAMPVVDRLDRDLKEAVGATIDLLCAPTGEGKTTALMQLAARLAGQSDTQVYWLDQRTSWFDPVETREMVAESGRTVLLIDRMDEQVDRLVELVKGQRQHLLGSPASLHVVGAARSYRWERARDRILGISDGCDTRMHAGVAFDSAAAAAVVACWGAFGPDGLRRLADLAPEARAAHLFAAAQARRRLTRRPGGRQGKEELESLYGGLLQVRMPTADLKAHIASLLADLEEKGPAARDAYLSIAVVDALGIDGLDERVLVGSLAEEADPLRLTLGQLHGLGEAFRERVLPRLTGEAGIVSACGGPTGLFQTRHPEIARAAVEVAVERVDADGASGLAHLARLLRQLVRWAVELGNRADITVLNHAPLTHCSVWIERRIGGALGGPDAADEVARGVAEAAWQSDRRADYLAEYLTRLRRVGDRALGCRLARESWDAVCAMPERADAVRSVAWHWAQMEAAEHNRPKALWLALLSLSDQLKRPEDAAPDPINANDLKKALLLLNSLRERMPAARALDLLAPLEGLREEVPTPENPDPGEVWNPREPAPPAPAVAEAMESTAGRLTGLDLPASLAGLTLSFNSMKQAYRRHIVSRFGPILAHLPPRDKLDDGGELADAFTRYATVRGTPPYAEQAEAILALAMDSNVLLNTPTGSGKSLVGVFAHFAALARNEMSAYTAPTKALVNEKFFQLCEHFGARNVGIATGDATVNAGAPILCCTAEVLASMALDEHDRQRFHWIVVDEFHYYDDKARGMAWLLPLLRMPQARFALLSATVGNAKEQCAKIARQTGRPTELVHADRRPVPLEFAYKDQPLRDSLAELRDGKLCPAYVVSFSKREASERAADPLRYLLMERKDDPDRAERRKAALRAERFDTPYGKQLRALLYHGVGVHHGGLLPRYKRVVERLTQQGFIDFVSGTDTLGVGVNLPLRSVILTQLYKYDGDRSRHLDAREFHQVCGRAGRKGYDEFGTAWVQAPEHKVQNRIAKAKKKKGSPAEPPKGFVDWNEEKFKALRDQTAQPLRTRLKVDGRLVMAMLARGNGGRPALHQLIDAADLPDNEATFAHRKADSLADTLLARVRAAPTATGAGSAERAIESHERIEGDTRLDRPLMRWLHFALHSREVDPLHPDFAMLVVSLVEAVLDEPSAVMRAQRWAARQAAFEERNFLRRQGNEEAAAAKQFELDTDTVEPPAPDAATILALFDRWVEDNPWYDGPPPAPRSVLREMYENQFGFNDYVAQYGLKIDEGALMKYLSEAYRVFATELPALQFLQADLPLLHFKDWLYTLVRSVDASIVHEWERLVYAEEVADIADDRPPPPPPVMLDSRLFRRQAQVEAFGWVRALHRLRSQRPEEWDLSLLTSEGFSDDAARSAAEAFYTEHDRVCIDADARSEEHFVYGPERVHQRIVDDDIRHDGEGTEPALDWEIVAELDRDGSVAAGRPILRLVKIGPV